MQGNGRNFTVVSWGWCGDGDDWIHEHETVTEAGARELARKITAERTVAARVCDTWSLAPLAQYDFTGHEMTAAEIAEWDDLTEAEQR